MESISFEKYVEEKNKKEEEYRLKCDLYDTHEELLDKNNINDYKRIKYMNGDGGLSGEERVYNEQEFLKFINGEPYDARAVEKYRQFVTSALDMLNDTIR